MFIYDLIKIKTFSIESYFCSLTSHSILFSFCKKKKGFAFLTRLFKQSFRLQYRRGTYFTSVGRCFKSICIRIFYHMVLSMICIFQSSLIAFTTFTLTSCYFQLIFHWYFILIFNLLSLYSKKREDTSFLHAHFKMHLGFKKIKDISKSCKI